MTCSKLITSVCQPDGFNIKDSLGTVVSKRGYYANGGYSYWSAEKNYYEMRIYDNGGLTFNKFSGSGTFNYNIIHSGNISSQNVSNSDMVDGYHYNSFVLSYHNANSNPNIDSFSDLPYILTVADTGSYGGGTKANGSHNGFGVLHMHTHSGNYFSQLGLDTNQNRLWMRSANDTSSFGSWYKVAYTSDIPSTISWSNVTSKPATATRWPAWSEVTDKPSTFTPSSHTHDYLPLSGGTMTGNISFSNSGTGFRGINYGTMGDNDQWRIGGAATGSNAGYMEIATADDGTEPIYVRQYTGVFSSLKRTATLLDGSGNTSFPGTVSASSFSGTIAWGNVSSKPNFGVSWNGYPVIGNDGVIEIGKYIDFHASASDTSDYCFRLTAASGSLTGSGSFYANSDRHKKKHIQSIDRQSLIDLFEVSDKLLKQFTWKQSGKTSYGFIAQQLEKYIPEAVLQDNESIKSVSYDIAYAKILASMIQEIKKLKALIENNK